MGSRRSVPYNYKTPPYVTAVPELVHYKLDLPRPSSSGTSSSTSSSNLVGDYCLVLATDGLYDDLMNEEIGELMTGFFEKTSTRRNTTRASLSSTSTTSKVKPKFVYEDTNAATHLIRNALIAGSKNDIGGILGMRLFLIH